ncbi:hypothetical protein RRF57_008770 [Xylaria bambusicola]|uniref:Uncharacterized protein n=1 Tax=Xylaria bambusicola TaxID=326684 RepID=A0AAN7UVV3_9PEZI
MTVFVGDRLKWTYVHQVNDVVVGQVSSNEILVDSLCNWRHKRVNPNGLGFISCVWTFFERGACHRAQRVVEPFHFGEYDRFVRVRIGEFGHLVRQACLVKALRPVDRRIYHSLLAGSSDKGGNIPCQLLIPLVEVDAGID